VDPIRYTRRDLMALGWQGESTTTCGHGSTPMASAHRQLSSARFMNELVRRIEVAIEATRAVVAVARLEGGAIERASRRTASR
jgi:hypothetical protein